MTLSLQLPERLNLKPTITVFGVGGGGGNAVGNMIRSNLEGVKFVVANTDAQALQESPCADQIQLGEAMTQGLGAGSYPEVGKASAEEAAEDVLDRLSGSNMVFITAGLGGGTGTGAAPVVARLAREQGILTVAVVTKPFHFEGSHRMRVAELGLQELSKYVDTLIVIPNQNLFRIADKNTTFLDAFKMADNVLYQGVRGITDLMVMPGMINLDFSDVRTVMSEMGKAMMGTGEGEGEKRAVEAAEAAIANPLLDNVSMKGAKGVLINITGGPDMTLYEVDEAANRIREEVDPDANIIFGSTFDQNLNGKVRVSVVSTGIDLISDHPSAPNSEGRSGSFKQGVYRQDPIKESAQETQKAAASLANATAPAAEEAKEGPIKAKPVFRPQTAQAAVKPALEEPISPSATLVFGNNAEKREESFIAPEPVKPKTAGFITNNAENTFNPQQATARVQAHPQAQGAGDTANAAKPSGGTSLFEQSAANAINTGAKNPPSGFFGGFFGSRKEDGPAGYQRPVDSKPEVRERELVSTEDDLDVPAFLRRKPS